MVPVYVQKGLYQLNGDPLFVYLSFLNWQATMLDHLAHFVARPPIAESSSGDILRCLVDNFLWVGLGAVLSRAMPKQMTYGKKRQSILPFFQVYRDENKRSSSPLKDSSRKRSKLAPKHGVFHI
jgi:hypothetical protein